MAKDIFLGLWEIHQTMATALIHKCRKHSDELIQYRSQKNIELHIKYSLAIFRVSFQDLAVRKTLGDLVSMGGFRGQNHG